MAKHAAKEVTETMMDENQVNSQTSSSADAQSSDAHVMEIGTAASKEKGKKSVITSIDDLPGIGPSIAAKLRDAGYDKLETLAYCMPSELQEISGVGEGSAVKVINAARDALEMGFETGADVLERRKLIEKITTGSLELDNLIGGGIETQAITEIFGKFGSGKSQIGFQLCVNAQLPKEQGGLGGSIAFIDTESTFRPERISQMAEAKGLDPAVVLGNIHVAKALNSNHQMLLAEKLEPMIREKNIRAIVVDSLTAAFRADYVGRGELAERQQKLNQHIHLLLRYADQYNLAVYVTNQVMDKPDILFGDPTIPIGGHVLAHTSTYRLYVRRSKEDRRIVKLVDSPNLPDGEVVFRVTPEGIMD
ncbi:DNA repair and recombination protein RadA [Candidatus Micrarchaeota archaeon]|nr:DNA repair and recombination protein RadA [Candidatus Micrarchaeota archaeon]